MHELSEETMTEKVLEETCVKVGKHLYLKNGSELKVDKKGEPDIQVVLSMGGSGTRMKHITKDEYSKHLVQVRGKPVSRYVFDMWVKAGFKDVCILTDDTHRGKSIVDYYKDGSKFGASISYSIEHSKLGSGGAFREAISNKAINRSFVSHYPDDVIVGYPSFAKDFARVFDAALKAGYECVVLCVPGKLYHYGVVEDIGGKVTKFIEKPMINKDTTAGIYGIGEAMFKKILELEPGKELKIERTVFKHAAESGKMLKVMLPTECWIPVNDEINLSKFIESSK